MKYVLKKDLPGIKAGLEVSKAPNDDRFWFLLDKEERRIADAYIPPSELSNWIEEIDETKPWEPKEHETYFVPSLSFTSLAAAESYKDDEIDKRLYERNLICRTKEEAIELADVALKAIKEYREGNR